MEGRDFPDVIIEFESVIFELLAEVFGSHVEAITQLLGQNRELLFFLLLDIRIHQAKGEQMQYFFFAIKDCNSVLKVGDLNLNCVIALTETFREKNRVLVISCEEEALLRVLLQLMHPNNA